VLADVLELKYDSMIAEVEAKHEAKLDAKLRDTARKMKIYGDSFDKISDITGLSIFEIEGL